MPPFHRSCRAKEISCRITRTLLRCVHENHAAHREALRKNETCIPRALPIGIMDAAPSTLDSPASQTVPFSRPGI